ncbi:MAG: hypothetical protein HOW73_47235 [Polyangiaceae bacterium]|nr:hypothetical protein [Polyangiaceae bacterium]
MVNADSLRLLAQRVSDALDVPMVCCCVLDRGWPAFVFYAMDRDERRSRTARLLTEMVLQVVRPIGEQGRFVAGRAAQLIESRTFVFPLMDSANHLTAAIGLASAEPRRWSSIDIERLRQLGQHLVDLGRPVSGVHRTDRRKRAISAQAAGTSRRPPRLKTSW